MDGNLTFFFFHFGKHSQEEFASVVWDLPRIGSISFFAQLIRKLNSPLYWDTHGRLRRQLIPPLVAWFLISV